MKFAELSDDVICKDTECSTHGCNLYHLNDFCLICQNRLGDKKLYVEIHGKWGWSPEMGNLKQEFICWDCVESLTICTGPSYKVEYVVKYLINA